MDPEDLRSAMPALEETAYMNTGASGPSPRRVVAAANDFLERHEYDAHATGDPYEVAFDAMDSARERVAGFVGAGDPDEIALTNSTADGISRVAAAVDFEPGDVVVRTDLEHPAGTLPWDRLIDTDDVEVCVLETDRGRLDMDALKDAVADARLLCLSSLSWNYGTRLRVSEAVEIAHSSTSTGCWPGDWTASTSTRAPASWSGEQTPSRPRVTSGCSASGAAASCISTPRSPRRSRPGGSATGA
jgi:selenocysteine lyase/cysteine desulfurase